MPLQIRRGTDAERTDSTFTPAEGELIYTTDTKKLYVGDGVTPGGVAIDTVGDDSTSSGVGGATVLDDLSDVVITSSDLGPGDVLKYDGVNWSASSVESISSLDDLLDVIIEDPVPGSILKYDGFHWTVGEDTGGETTLDDLSNVAIGDLDPGDVLTYDGVNWTANSIPTSGLTSISEDINPALGGFLNLNGNSIFGDGDINISGEIFANLTYSDTDGDHFGDVIADDSTTKLVDATLQRFNGSLIGDVTGNVTGNVTGDVTGNVTGDIVGSIFSDNSTLLVDGVNNRLIGPIETNTVTSNSTLNINISGPLNFNVDGDVFIERVGPSILYYVNNQLAEDLSQPGTLHGIIGFKTIDVNGTNTSALIGTSSEGFSISKTDAAYALPDSNKFFIGTDGKFGFGTVTPTEKFEFAGNTKVNGFVQFGSLTTAERDALTAVNGMVIYNTTLNKFQGYENSAWVNLI